MVAAVYDHSDPRPSWWRAKHVLDCPALARWRAEQPREETAAMTVGTLMHCAILEPGAMAERYVSPPEIVKIDGWTPTGARGAWYLPALPGRQWATRAEAEAAARPWGWIDLSVPMPAGPDGDAPGYATAPEARAALGRLVTGTWASPELLALARQWGADARALLPGGERSVEVPLYGRLEGVSARGCADVIVDGRVIVDVKTVADVTPRGVARAAAAGRWHGQLATYAMLALQRPEWAGVGLDDVALGVLVVQAPSVSLSGGGLRLVGTQPRPHARLEWLDGAGRAYAYAEARDAWRLWRDCTATGRWPDYAGGLEPRRWQVDALGEVEEVEVW